MVKKRRKRDDELALAIGQRLASAMGDMSMSELARQVDVTSNTIWNILNGNSCPSLPLLIKIGEVLGVSTDFILKGNKPGQLVTTQEEELLSTYRTIQEADPAVAEEIISFGRFKLGSKPPAKTKKASLKKKRA